MKELEVMKKLYAGIQNLIYERKRMLLVLSGLAWFFEYKAVGLLGEVFEDWSRAEIFNSYINANFWGNENQILESMRIFSIVLFLCFGIGIYAVSLIRRRGKKNAQNIMDL